MMRLPFSFNTLGRHLLRKVQITMKWIFLNF